jgi:hypothetical protein
VGGTRQSPESYPSRPDTNQIVPPGTLWSHSGDITQRNGTADAREHRTLRTVTGHDCYCQTKLEQGKSMRAGRLNYQVQRRLHDEKQQVQVDWQCTISMLEKPNSFDNPPRMLPLAKQAEVGYRTNSPWSSPFIVRKKNGDLHFCMDYKKSHYITRENYFPLSRMDNTAHCDQGPKLRITLLARVSSNLPHQSRQFHNPVCVVRQKNIVMGPKGPKTKNDCSGKGQQQFTQQTYQASQ